MARCEGRPRASFSLNTVTSLAPRRAGCGTYAGIRPKDLASVRRSGRCAPAAAPRARREAGQRRLHGADQVGHRQQGRHVRFVQEAEVLWTIVASSAARGQWCWRGWSRCVDVGGVAAAHRDRGGQVGGRGSGRARARRAPAARRSVSFRRPRPIAFVRIGAGEIEDEVGLMPGHDRVERMRERRRDIVVGACRRRASRRGRSLPCGTGSSSRRASKT